MGEDLANQLLKPQLGFLRWSSAVPAVVEALWAPPEYKTVTVGY
jgi:hypothetical protein